MGLPEGLIFPAMSTIGRPLVDATQISRISFIDRKIDRKKLNYDENL
jgi:hypothetical protein